MILKLSVVNKLGETLLCGQGQNEVILMYQPQYQDGNSIVLECSEPQKFIFLQLDDAMSPSLIYLKDTDFSYPVPFGEKKLCYSQRSFSGERHVLTVREAYPNESAAYRNLAFNPWDYHENISLYPHAVANVETRGESVFAARNAIDGLKANTSHGEWPYTSWGINCNPNAQWKLDFGRKVVLNKAVFYLRADFPHDAWWENATLHFSNGSNLTVELVKTGKPQVFDFDEKAVEWVTLDTLIKADDPSVFPALTQLELYGSEFR